MRNGRVPTMADALAAAQVAESAGATQVLLFGSLARGDAKPGSDLDLVAVFDDLDYCDRYSRERELNRAIEARTGLANDVVVTDRPEWALRSSGAVPYSFEPVIAQHAIKLIDNPPKGRVLWDKPMAIPTNPAEAATERLRDLTRKWHDIREKQADSSPLRDRSAWRTYFDYDYYLLTRMGRFKTLCGHAHLVVESCLKMLIVLHCKTSPRHLYTHDIEALVTELDRHAPDQAAYVERLRGDLSHQDISDWHQRANYDDADIAFDQPASRHQTAALLRLAAAYTRHTLNVYRQHTSNEADEIALDNVLQLVESVARRIGADGEGLDPPDLPGDDPPHPEEIEQLKTEQFLARQRRARHANPDGS